MYAVYNERYLKLELYNGNYYDESPKGRDHERLNSQYIRSNFEKMEMMFDLTSFDFKESEDNLFQNNRKMKTVSRLASDIDTFNLKVNSRIRDFKLNILSKYQFHQNDELHKMLDSISRARSIKE